MEILGRFSISDHVLTILDHHHDEAKNVLYTFMFKMDETMADLLESRRIQQKETNPQYVSEGRLPERECL